MINGNPHNFQVQVECWCTVISGQQVVGVGILIRDSHRFSIAAQTMKIHEGKDQVQ